MKKKLEIDLSEKEQILEMYSQNKTNLLNEQVGVIVGFLVAGLAAAFGTKSLQSQFLTNKLSNMLETSLQSIETLNKKLRENKSYYGQGTEAQQQELIKIFTENYSALEKLKDGIESGIERIDTEMESPSSEEFLKQSISKINKEYETKTTPLNKPTAKPSTNTISNLKKGEKIHINK